MLRLVLLLTLLVLPSCGYRFSGKKMNGGEGKTIGVPTFANRTTTYRLEQKLTEAVRGELIRRTNFRVLPGPVGDVAVSGEVLTFVAIPIIFNSQGRGSSYSIAIDLSVRVTDRETGQILFQNERWTFREVFELSQASAEFVLEDTAAIDRLARRFAASLIASMLHTQP